jgi:hypothetical protein
MARMKVRLVLNKGRHGAPLSKLGKISEQAERFLRALAGDCRIETKPGEWLAVNFKNGSVEYDAEFQGDVNVGAAEIFARNLEQLADYDEETEGLNLPVSSATALEYARIGSLIDPDEVIGLGIFPARGGKPKWRTITYSKAAAIRREVEQPLPTYGAVQGIVHAWFKEARDPYFQIREISTDALVKVLYSSNMYSDVVRACEERTSVLIVTGNMLLDRASRLTIELRAERIERVSILSTEEFERFFGSAPDFIADLESDTGPYA